MVEYEKHRFAPDAGIDAINALVTALQPLDEAGTQALRAVVHELRTPLTSVTGFVELLADRALGPMTDDQHRVLRTISRNVRRLADLVDALEPADPGRIRESTRP